MPRFAARADGNQKKVVAGLRKMGYFVRHTHTIGQGFPDVLVSKEGWCALLEIKDPAQPLSKQSLTEHEARFFVAFPGPVFKVRTALEADEKLRSWKGMSDEERRALCADRRRRTTTLAQGGRLDL